VISLNGDNQGFRYFSAHITVMDEFIVTVYYAKPKGKRASFRQIGIVSLLMPSSPYCITEVNGHSAPGE